MWPSSSRDIRKWNFVASRSLRRRTKVLPLGFVPNKQIYSFLSIVTMISLPRLLFNLPAYLGSALVKRIPPSGSSHFFPLSPSFRISPLHPLHLPLWPHWSSWKKCFNSSLVSRSLHFEHCLHRIYRVGFCHQPLLSNSGSYSASHSLH